MTVIAGLLLLIALVCWTYGVLRFVHWVIALRDAHVDAAFRADQLVAQARAEFACSELCDTTVAAEHRAEQMADATSGYYFDAEVSRG
jgi:hypothetical protein